MSPDQDHSCPSPPEGLATSNNLVLSVEQLIFSNCSASVNQENFPCEDAIQEEGDGWAYGGVLPASIVLEMKDSSAEIRQIELIASENYRDHWPNNFMFEFLQNGDWIWPNWVEILEPEVAYFDQATGEIEVGPTVLKTVIKFDPITDITQVRLKIYKTSAGNGNAVVKIKAYGTFPDPKYHLQIPTPIG